MVIIIIVIFAINIFIVVNIILSVGSWVVTRGKDPLEKLVIIVIIIVVIIIVVIIIVIIIGYEHFHELPSQIAIKTTTITTTTTTTTLIIIFTLV